MSNPSQQNQVFLIESVQQIEYVDAPAESIWSAFPASYNREQTVRLRSPESLASESAYRLVWERLSSNTSRLNSAFLALEQENSEFVGAADLMLGQIVFAASALACKAMALSAWLDDNRGSEAVLLASATVSDPGNIQVPFNDRDNLYAALASEMRQPFISVRSVGQPSFPQNTDQPPKLERLLNVFNRPLSAIAWKIYSRISRPESVSKNEKALLYIVENDLVEEAFFSLKGLGWSMKKVSLPQSGHLADNDLPTKHPKLLDDLEVWWTEALEGYASKEVIAAGHRLLLPRVRRALSRYPEMDRIAQRAAEELASHKSDSVRLAVLSGGLYSPIGRRASVHLRDLGVPVICCEHGTGLGVSARTDRFASDLQGFSDLYLVHNQDTQQRLQSSDKKTGIFRVIGSPYVMRSARFPFIQHHLTRNLLGCKRQQELLIYVCNLLVGNRIQGLGQTPDYYYYNFRENIVKILDQFNGVVRIKKYPFYRYVDGDPVTREQLPPHIGFAPLGEFRHIRWAADLLLLDICSSTLGWAMATNKPLIYINNASNPMSERATDAARDALLFIDAVNDPQWSDGLRRLLKLPRQERWDLWQSKTKKREIFLNQFQLGPTGNVAKRVASAVEEMAGG